MSTYQTPPRPVVHLELHTPDRVAASAFYRRLFHWRPELIRAGRRAHLAVDTGSNLDGGFVECETPIKLEDTMSRRTP